MLKKNLLKSVKTLKSWKTIKNNITLKHFEAFKNQTSLLSLNDLLYSK